MQADEDERGQTMFGPTTATEAQIILQRHEIRRRLVDARPAVEAYLQPEQVMPAGVLFDFPGGRRVAVMWVRLDDETVGWTVGKQGDQIPRLRENMSESVDGVVEIALLLLDEHLKYQAPTGD